MIDLHFTAEAATILRDEHDPEHQDHGYARRCALCSFTRHPCDVYALASDWLALAERAGI